MNHPAKDKEIFKIDTVGETLLYSLLLLENLFFFWSKLKDMHCPVPDSEHRAISDVYKHGCDL
jgi:hypothetical protein